MKMGFVTAILEHHSFEGVIDFAADHGFSCVELACWPRGKAERRYAGVSHLDVNILDEEKINYVQEYCAKRGVEISSLAYYPNTMEQNLEKRNAHITHLKNLITLSCKLGVGMVTTFVGRDQSKTVEDNLLIFDQVWPDIIRCAEENQVQIAIENCPMLFGKDQWPGGQNLACTPEIWQEMFHRIPSPYFGLNYDPSHFVWQMMDYIAPIYDFKDRIFHVHFKDIKLYPGRLNQVGIMSYPLNFMQPKLPGLGDVNWGKFISALNDIGYEGYACIEVEDRAFEGSEKRIEDSLVLSKRYLDQFLI